MQCGGATDVRLRVVASGSRVTAEWTLAGILILKLNCAFYHFVLSNVCAARYSGVISYKHSSTRVVSGCTQKPSPGNQVLWVICKFWNIFCQVQFFIVFYLEIISVLSRPQEWHRAGCFGRAALRSNKGQAEEEPFIKGFCSRFRKYFFKVKIAKRKGTSYNCSRQHFLHSLIGEARQAEGHVPRQVSFLF